MSREALKQQTIDVIERLALSVKLAELNKDPRIPEDWSGAIEVYDLLLLLAEIADDYNECDKVIQ